MVNNNKNVNEIIHHILEQRHRKLCLISSANNQDSDQTALQSDQNPACTLLQSICMIPEECILYKANVLICN